MKRRGSSDDWVKEFLRDFYNAWMEKPGDHPEQEADADCQMRLYEDITKEDLDFLVSCNVRWD